MHIHKEVKSVLAKILQTKYINSFLFFIYVLHVKVNTTKFILRGPLYRVFSSGHNLQLQHFKQLHKKGPFAQSSFQNLRNSTIHWRNKLFSIRFQQLEQFMRIFGSRKSHHLYSTRTTATIPRVLEFASFRGPN